MSRSMIVACQALLAIVSALTLGGCIVRGNPQPVYYNQPVYARPAPVVYARPAPVVYAQPVYAPPTAAVYVR